MGGSGDPAPGTAAGVFHGIRASAERGLGSDELDGRTVLVEVSLEEFKHLALLEGETVFLYPKNVRVFVPDAGQDLGKDI